MQDTIDVAVVDFKQELASPGHWGGRCRAEPLAVLRGLASAGAGSVAAWRLGRVARSPGDSQPPWRSAESRSAGSGPSRWVARGRPRTPHAGRGLGPWGRRGGGQVGGAAAGGVRLGEWEELGACESAIVGWVAYSRA